MPILLRTVAPRPAGGSPPIQLPMAPLPKSALNNAGDKKSDASAKAIQVLLPKSPLPPQSGIVYQCPLNVDCNEQSCDRVHFAYFQRKAQTMQLHQK